MCPPVPVITPNPERPTPVVASASTVNSIHSPLGQELPFEESCITFYETDRSVRTASSEQVRKPVNRSGQGRWKPYAKNLGAVVQNIDNNLLKPEDITLIKSQNVVFLIK